ncbi:MAG: regulatory protein RecX [Chloroflexi bacterium]|nr:regulatory protein RecX [Chloroflexota bacterium]
MVWSKTRRSSRSPRPVSRDEYQSADDVVGGTVTSIETQRRAGSERFNVFVDGAFAFSLAAELALNFREGDTLDVTAVRQALARDQGQRAYEQALRFLAPRPRSVAEVRLRLKRHGHDMVAVDATIQRLADHQFVDDDEFAAFWVGQRQTHHPLGPRALRSELRSKGVDVETTDRAIEPAVADQEASAYRAAEKKARGLSLADERTFGQVLTGYLLRRGFDYDAVRSSVRRLWIESRESES